MLCNFSLRSLPFLAVEIEGQKCPKSYKFSDKDLLEDFLALTVFSLIYLNNAFRL